MTHVGFRVQYAAKTPTTAPLAPRELEMKIERSTIPVKLATLPITPVAI